VWAYDAGAMAWRRAIALETPGAPEDGGGEPINNDYPSTARACAWAPSLGRADELVAVALGGGGSSGDVALYRLPLLASAEEDGGGRRWPVRLKPIQTLRHVWQGLPLSAWRLQFNATGTALAASVEEEGGGGGGGGGHDDAPPPQVWFWMPNLESGVWRAVASVEGGEEGFGDEDEGGVMMLGQ
jgi:hypothetical protein